MEQGRGKLGIWVVLCSAVPLAALGAVLLLNAPALWTTAAAFAVLMLIAPRLLAVASAGSGKGRRGDEPGPRNRTDRQ